MSIYLTPILSKTQSKAGLCSLCSSRTRTRTRYAPFAGTGVNITTEGKRYLGAALGTEAFVSAYVKEKVKEWISKIKHLSQIAKTQPHAAYSALTHGLSSEWTFLFRTILNITDLLEPLEQAIRSSFIPSITGKPEINNAERELLALPTRLGGLGLTNPMEVCNHDFKGSENVTAPLVKLILLQQHHIPFDAMQDQQMAKVTARTSRNSHTFNTATQLKERLSPSLKRSMELASEKGASSWLTALPITEHGFALHKGAFRDALCLRYNWQPTQLPKSCACGHAFTVNHVLSCPTGGLPTLRHNELRDFTAEMMSEVCHNVCIEPPLQPLSCESFTHASATTEDEARLDISAQGFWGNQYQMAFFDVRVFNQKRPNIPEATVTFSISQT